MSKVTWKSGTFIYPLPAVMVSCGTMEESNIITVAWTGIINTDPAMCYISVRPTRHSYEMIKKTGEFVINLTTKDLAYATDWCGVKTGAKVDKFKEMKLTKEKANFVSCPMIKESPVSVECKVKEIKELGKILGVYLDNAIEASVKSEDKKLGFEAYLIDNKVKIIISNTYKGELSKEKIGNEIYSTKGKNRGHGLLLVKEIVSNNKMFNIDTEITDSLYIQSLTIE